MNVTFTAVGLTGVQDTLKDWQKRIERGHDLEKISDIVLKSTLHNYDTAQDDRRWPKRKKDVPWPILIKTGTKRQTELASIVRAWNKIARGFEKDIYSTDYGKLHQTGTSRLPYRKSVYLSETVKQEILANFKASFRPVL